MRRIQGHGKDSGGTRRIQRAWEGPRGHGKDLGGRGRIQVAREGFRGHGKDPGNTRRTREHGKDSERMREKATHVRKYLVCVVTVS